MTYETLRYEVADGVATVTLDRPAVHNAMNETMRRELTACFTALATDDAVRAVVVTGAGDRAFSAGADIREFVQPEPPTVFREQRRRVDFRRAMDACPQPLIAAIRGWALGGGLELVGRGKALELILTGARIGAEEALRIGLVERVVPAAEVLREAQALARALADKAPLAVRYAKEAVVKGLELPLEAGLRLEHDLSALLRTTEDRLEGARAFLDKRPPRWTGR
jgi:enoyl-CoA hydratase